MQGCTIRSSFQKYNKIQTGYYNGSIVNVLLAINNTHITKEDPKSHQNTFILKG